MTMRDGTDPTEVRDLVQRVLEKRGFVRVAPDGWQHHSGEHVNVGYSGQSWRIRRYAPEDRKRVAPTLLDTATMPTTDQLDDFLGEICATHAPRLSRREQELVAQFEGVQVVLEHEHAHLPTRGYPGDAGVDLYTSETTVVPPGQFRDVPTGIRLGLPEGYWARITGRSSTLRKRGLMVAEGVIDNGYTGPIFAGVWNLSDYFVEIAVGDRLAQLILHRIEPLPFEEAVGIVSVDGRGSNGFGSSGV